MMHLGRRRRISSTRGKKENIAAGPSAEPCRTERESQDSLHAVDEWVRKDRPQRQWLNLGNDDYHARTTPVSFLFPPNSPFS